jgi:hypothetical protein
VALSCSARASLRYRIARALLIVSQILTQTRIQVREEDLGPALDRLSAGDRTARLFSETGPVEFLTSISIEGHQYARFSSMA